MTRWAAQAGIGEGGCVALLMHNGLDQVLVWFALARLGAVHAPLNTALFGERLGYALRVTRASVLVADAELLTVLTPVLDRLPELDRVIVRGGSSDGRFEDLADHRGEGTPAPVAEVDELAAATMLFTSGTTGASKACVLSHRYLARQGQLHAKYLGLRSDDVLYCPFPLFHIDAATLTVVAALACRGTAALSRRFSASRFWAEVRAFDASVFNFMGATLTILWKQPPYAGDRDHRVRLAWGVPMPEWHRGWEERFGIPLRQVYGLTDGGVSVYDPVDGPRKPGACGRVIPEFDVRIEDGHGSPLPSGEIGEIMVRGREPGLVMNGYHAMPEATAQVFRNGRLRTGDLGRFDDDGYLTFEGRLSDSIRRRGENISAHEVEQVLIRHPAVLEAAAIGVPSELTEEDVKAVVVPRPGATLTPGELHAFCRATAPGYMVPRYIELVPTLPKTPTQKIEKFRLRQDGITQATWDGEARHG
ncbi:AMP-binding protein [Streptosporangium sp. NBC_01755]|uniref:AMP-binding protein n=1 Tax=Streptosporangium sp. NBC_01755 TaxID=2975949 RepID=UPI002DDC0A08|nr:AMP-binding protein [Streptosporangium sp. NBC_01755]WSD02623.1 AMP-binding protein [Streptosporangium sp. NBC_01755]